MPYYELLFGHEMETEVLKEGDAYRYGGKVWLVERLEELEDREAVRVFLTLWPKAVPYPPDVKGGRSVGISRLRDIRLGRSTDREF